VIQFFTSKGNLHDVIQELSRVESESKQISCERRRIRSYCGHLGVSILPECEEGPDRWNELGLDERSKNAKGDRDYEVPSNGRAYVVEHCFSAAESDVKL
jgi:hypothetical protein